jgi:hypothetical protein
MVGIAPEVFVTRYPRLWHMAEANSWESVRRHGLLSTSALLDRFGVEGAKRLGLESARRPRSVTITHPVHGSATIRDNVPLLEKVLERTLVGTTPREWYEALNRRVFFWVSQPRFERLRSARAYSARRHDILEVDTAALVARHIERMTLSPINSGATHRHPTLARGRDIPAVAPLPLGDTAGEESEGASR